MQTLIVVAIVGASAFYLYRRMRRSFSGKSGCGCGCGSCSASARRLKNASCSSCTSISKLEDRVR